MKTILCAALALSIFYSPVHAQNKQFEYGVHGGPNFNNIHGSNVNKNVSAGSKGFTTGVHIKMKLSEKLGLKAIIQYEENGWKDGTVSFEDPNGNGLIFGDLSYKLNYLTLPLMAEFSFGNKTVFYCNAGIFLGFLLSDKAVIKTPGSNGSISYPYPANFSSINAGLAMGAGLQIPLSPNVRLGLGAHNNLGLNNIMKSTAVNSGSAKTNSLSVLAGFIFTL